MAVRFPSKSTDWPVPMIFGSVWIFSDTLFRIHESQYCNKMTRRCVWRSRTLHHRSKRAVIWKWKSQFCQWRRAWVAQSDIEMYFIKFYNLPQILRCVLINITVVCQCQGWKVSRQMWLTQGRHIAVSQTDFSRVGFSVSKQFDLSHKWPNIYAAYVGCETSQSRIISLRF